MNNCQQVQRGVAYEEPQATTHYRAIGKRKCTTSETAQFREGLRNHEYISPTHVSNKALYGDGLEHANKGPLVKNEPLVVSPI